MATVCKFPQPSINWQMGRPQNVCGDNGVRDVVDDKYPTKCMIPPQVEREGITPIHMHICAVCSPYRLFVERWYYAGHEKLH